MNNKKTFAFSAIRRKSTERVDFTEKTAKGFVRWGYDNSFPNYLIGLYNNSSIHNTCVDAVVEAIIGEGLVCDKSYLLDKANSEGETWNDIFRKITADYKRFGGFSFEVIWSQDRSRVAEVYHIDFSWTRAKEKTLRGKIPGYYISDQWTEKYKFAEGKEIDLPYLPAYNPARKLEEPKQIFVYNPYKPGQNYYPLPDYVGALKVIELDAEVDNFHVNNIKNGLAPSIAITTFTNADPDEREANENMLRLQYAGSDNAGSFIYMDVDSPENAPIITPIPQNGADGYYTVLNDVTTQKILTAHRITSPEILGIKTPGKLGSKEEVTEAYLLFLNTVIRPYQQILAGVVEDMLYIMHPEQTEISIGISQLRLFYDGSTEQDVITSVDAEVGEDKDLEKEIQIQDRENINQENIVG